MDPAAAPPRPDLTFLRRRSRPAPRPATPGPSSLADFVSGRATHDPSHLTPPAAPANPPATPPAPPPAPAAPSRISASLDLSEEPVIPPAAARAAPTEAVAVMDADDRVAAGARRTLSVKAPTVTLTRLQSGIGTLTIEAAVPAEGGDARLGCAYELGSGVSSTVQLNGGNRFGPPNSRRPVLVAGHDRFERVSIDLRRCQQLRRLIIYLFSESRRQLVWGGTLIVTTYGGARVEAPLEALGAGELAVALSLYNVRGEFVIRAETQPVTGSIREACRAYGFDRISWQDDRNPVD